MKQNQNNRRQGDQQTRAGKQQQNNKNNPKSAEQAGKEHNDTQHPHQPETPVAKPAGK